jgi:hypothetical protein
MPEVVKGEVCDFCSLAGSAETILKLILVNRLAVDRKHEAVHIRDTAPFRL